MKIKYLLLPLLLLLQACTGGKQHIASSNGFAVLPAPNPSVAVATFAGGCFWAMQESLIQLKGVNTVISGYAGGDTEHPTYDEIQTQRTGHAEAVQVYYDPAVISYEQLLTAFFLAHNPTELNRQGPDIGSEYRSIAFYRNEKELKSISKVMKAITDKGYYTAPIVTDMQAFSVFYPAESHHQDYYERNSWEPYVRNVCKPKVLHVRKELPQLIKPDYLK